MHLRRSNTIIVVLPSLLFILAISFSASAQSGVVELAPPPLSIISKAEQDQLDRARDVGDRIKLALKLMEQRTAGAESAFSNQNFDGMFKELGAFHALMEDSLTYLNQRNTGRGKVLDNFKRLEIGLRRFMPRLEIMRREIPLRYEDYVRKLIIRIRDAREKATEPLFGETVIPPQRPKQ
jgi:hypothetical protein